MTTGANDWGEVYLNDDEIAAKRRAWVDAHRDELAVAFEEFLSSAQWPERERFRRRLVQRNIAHGSLEDLLNDMPRSWWEQKFFPPDNVVLSLQVLQELPEAQQLLTVCVTIVQRAYELYVSEEEEPVLSNEDEVLLGAAHGDGHLLLCAREVLSQHPPHPLGGGTSGTDSTVWTRTLNEAAMPAFKDVGTVGEYLAAQERMRRDEQDRYGRVPPPTTTARPLSRSREPGAGAEVVGRASSPIEAFVVMPFSDPWSDGVYAFIRRVVAQLGAPEGALHLYRADEIAAPGQITEQIKAAIAGAHVLVADITGVNPNVMWELGYADGLGKTIVILNQEPGSSPFDMVDRRQVAYRLPPTEADEANLLRHLRQALPGIVEDWHGSAGSRTDPAAPQA